MQIRILRLAAWCSAAVLAAGCSASQMPTAPTPPSAAPVSPAPPPAAPAAARYRVTFEATWTASTHPVDAPSTPHFSPLIGGTHAAATRFWSEGALASAGIRDMAERGRTSPLDREIEAAIAAGTAERVLLGAGISSPGTTSLEFDVTQAYPLVTLVTMVAPSPDWFAGVSALPLFENGEWMEQRRVELIPWDAGTDSGTTFNSPDAATHPPQAISRITTAPLSPGGRVTALGTLTFTRLH